MGVPVSLSSALTLGRSSSPARSVASAYQSAAASLSQRGLSAADSAAAVAAAAAAAQGRYVPFPGGSSAAAGAYAGLRNVREAAVYMTSAVSLFTYIYDFILKCID